MSRPWCGWASSPSSSVPDDVLVSLGLGSCIGLALIDRRRAIAGLAHVVLPAVAGTRPRAPAQVRRSSPCRRCSTGLERPRRPHDACSRPCSWAAPACSRSPRPASRSASATRPPCATCSEAAHPRRGRRDRRRPRPHGPRRRGRLGRDGARGGRQGHRAARGQPGAGCRGMSGEPDRSSPPTRSPRSSMRPERAGCPRTAPTPQRRRRMRAVDFTRPTKFTSEQERRLERGARRVLPDRLDAPVGRAARAARARGHRLDPAHVGERPRAGARRTRSTALVHVQPIGTRMLLAGRAARSSSARSSCCSAGRTVGERHASAKLTDID